MNFGKRTVKRKIDKLPICRYGSSCYRKNPEHRNKYSHPSDEPPDNVNEVNCTDSNFSPDDETHQVKRQKIAEDVTDSKIDTSKQNPCISGFSLEDESAVKPTKEIKRDQSVKELLKSMPKDFFDFWDFCSLLNKSKPEEAFAEFGIHLVGPFDLLSKKLLSDKIVNLNCHWRYYYDPPEFQTIIKFDGEDLHHLGYFRDDPNELPSIVASNDAEHGPQLHEKGDNIFAAMNFELTGLCKKCRDKKQEKKLTSLQKELIQYAKTKRHSLDIPSSKFKARSKKIVTKTFHGLGIVVPVKNDIGYRPLPDSDAKVKSILRKIVSAPNEEKRLQEEEKLDELISNVQFANDECDYGMGLELGIDLFCFGDPYFHSHILHLLPLAYKLLKRPKYAEIVEAHLMNRKKSDDLDTLNG